MHAHIMSQYGYDIMFRGYAIHPKYSTGNNCDQQVLIRIKDNECLYKNERNVYIQIFLRNTGAGRERIEVRIRTPKVGSEDASTTM